MADHTVLVIGAGVAGLSAGVDLARFNIDVKLIEKADFPGGHAIGFACKAADKCVKCGACLAEEKLKSALEHPHMEILSGSRVKHVSKTDRFVSTVIKKPVYIDPEKCTACGKCMNQCPNPVAVVGGRSGNHRPFFALDEDRCRYLKDQSCTLCQDICPEGAITLNQKETEFTLASDAIVVATGFQTYNPFEKPYGYGVFKNVITNLDLEWMLRRENGAKRPSDDSAPGRIAFIQCVGSRDVKLKRPWCSKICCASALRMAGLIKAQHPKTEITFFYIDVQTFGKDFEAVYRKLCDDIRMVRSIPGDIFITDENDLRVAFSDPVTRLPTEAVFDLVVLSTGIEPNPDTSRIAEILNLDLNTTGFIDQAGKNSESGVFSAGTVTGPMGISETISNAGSAAWQVLRFLKKMPPTHS
jgi:heterodisulfide reductase subunit A